MAFTKAEVKLSTDFPESIQVDGDDYCLWCYMVRKPDDDLDGEIGLDFPAAGTKIDAYRKFPKIVDPSGEMPNGNESFQKKPELKGTSKSTQKADPAKGTPERQIISKKVGPDDKQSIDICFLIAGKCNNSNALVPVSLEQKVGEEWTRRDIRNHRHEDGDPEGYKRIEGPIVTSIPPVGEPPAMTTLAKYEGIKQAHFVAASLPLLEARSGTIPDSPAVSTETFFLEEALADETPEQPGSDSN